LRRHSIGLVKLQSEQLHNLFLVKTHHRLAVNNRHRRTLKALVKELLQDRFVGAEIFLDELDTLLR